MLQYANEYDTATSVSNRRRDRRDGRLRYKLYVTQLLLAMTVASDDAVAAIRATEGLPDAASRVRRTPGKNRDGGGYATREK
jgi:hypothetical protein